MIERTYMKTPRVPNYRSCWILCHLEIYMFFLQSQTLQRGRRPHHSNIARCASVGCRWSARTVFSLPAAEKWAKNGLKQPFTCTLLGTLMFLKDVLSNKNQRGCRVRNGPQRPTWFFSGFVNEASNLSTYPIKDSTQAHPAASPHLRPVVPTYKHLHHGHPRRSTSAKATRFFQKFRKPKNHPNHRLSVYI